MDTVSSVEPSTTLLLQRWRAGDKDAQDQLFSLLYVELTKLSSAYLTHERGVSLTAGDLVNESVIRLMNIDKLTWHDKAHFMALAAITMRRILVEHVRKKRADKREHQPVTLVTNLEDDSVDSVDTYAINEALLRLHTFDQERAKIVELRFFGGLSVDEIAEVMNISPSTVKRSWRASKAWLLSELRSD